MKNNIIIAIICLSFLSIWGCKQKENCKSCTLNEYKTQVCELPNGHAELEGKDSGKPYDEFINSIISRGGACK